MEERERKKQAELAPYIEQALARKQRMAELIAFHSGKELEQIQEDSERDRWFTAEEAKDYGIIDEVITRRGEIG